MESDTQNEILGEDQGHLEVPLELSEQKPLFVADFVEGYSFRGIIDYLKLTNSMGDFVFCKDSIFYSKSDPSVTILNNLEIRTPDLTLYQFNHDTPIAYGINMNNLKQTLSVVGKKDGVRLISFISHPYLFTQRLGAGNDEASKKNLSMVRISATDFVEMTVDTYKRSENDPNCTVRVQEFCKACADIVRIKCDYVTIKGSPSGVRVQAMLDGNVTGSCCDFGHYNKVSLQENTKNVQLKRLTEYLHTLFLDTQTLPTTTPATNVKIIIKDDDGKNIIRVKSAYIKALSKLTNSFKEGTVKIYHEPGLPLKLIFNNTYCRLTVFLKNQE